MNGNSGLGGGVLSAALCMMATIGLALLPARAAPLTGADLVRGLQKGAYVVVIRHASSPDAPPPANVADPQNVTHERQLDATGRKTVQAMGEAIRSLHIPVGKVLSSPTYRAKQTAQLAGLGKLTIQPELGDAGHSMERDAVANQAGWLRRQAGELPAAGANTFIVTQEPNIATAFGQEAADLKAGGALVFQPNGKGGETLVGRVPIEEWPALANAAR